jgi:hypothetical protein
VQKNREKDVFFFLAADDETRASEEDQRRERERRAHALQAIDVQLHVLSLMVDAFTRKTSKTR